MSRELYDKIKDLREKSFGLRNYETKYDLKSKKKQKKAFEIQDKQNEIYKKFMFMKNLDKAMQKGKNENNN